MCKIVQLLQFYSSMDINFDFISLKEKLVNLNGFFIINFSLFTHIAFYH